MFKTVLKKIILGIHKNKNDTKICTDENVCLYLDTLLI